MPSLENINQFPTRKIAHAKALAGIATATAAAPGTKKRWLVDKLLITANGEVAAGVLAEFQIDGVMEFEIGIPAAEIAPVSISFRPPILAPANKAVSLMVPSLGGGITGTATIFGKEASL